MNYDSFATTFSNSRKNHPWPELDYILEDMKKRDSMHILDIGCGNGRFLEEAEKLGFQGEKYIGIDSSLEMVQEAKKIHPSHTFLHGEMQDASEIVYRTGYRDLFDSILLLASFHHLDFIGDREVVLYDLKSLLSPNGRIYLTNWNLRDQRKYDAMKKDEGEYAIKIGEYSRYYHGFTLDELSSLFHETGYNVVEHSIFEGGRNFLSILSLPRELGNE